MSSPDSAADIAGGGRSSDSDAVAVGPLDGIRVIEVAINGFVPSAGAVLAEWGADVIKAGTRIIELKTAGAVT
jgi:hypothetical protein